MKKIKRYFKLKREFKKYCKENEDTFLKGVQTIYLSIDSIEYEIRKAVTGDCVDKYGEHFELINKKLDRVVFRKSHYTTGLDSSYCSWIASGEA